MSHRICIHGHFYQPPRENPWTGRIDSEPSAAPWPNWNARIADECYGPNTDAEILGADGAIVRRVNNFAHISFNVGPTLLAWLEAERPATYDAILAADAASASRFRGHGSAIAQGFDHVILPLASPRDRTTQVRWGVDDFVRRFGRRPEGMWLPETAVDVPTLETLAAHGVSYTILAPSQAARVRDPEGDWRPAAEEDLSSRPYAVRLPSGSSLWVFFYDGALARGIAFGGWLHDGAALADRLRHAAADSGHGLVHLATDGESYGHHHPRGEMALARAIEAIEEDPGSGLVNYGALLDAARTETSAGASEGSVAEAEVAGRTAWSCAHGIRRWAGGCDCGSGGEGWSYEWRTGLRTAIERLSETLAATYEAEGSRVLSDPWAARDDGYGALFGSATDRAAWTEAWVRPGEDDATAFRLLEMQRHAMSMFVSCGWFFDDPTGLGTRIALRSAARAVELAESFDRRDLRAAVGEDLAGISSNRKPGWTAAAEWRRIFREDRSPRPTPAVP